MEKPVLFVLGPEGLKVRVWHYRINHHHFLTRWVVY